MNRKSKKIIISKRLIRILTKFYAIPKNRGIIPFFNNFKWICVNSPILVVGFLGYMYELLTVGGNISKTEQVESMQMLIQSISFSALILVWFKNSNSFYDFIDNYMKFEFGIPKNFRKTLRNIDKLATISHYSAILMSTIGCSVRYLTNSFCTGLKLLEDSRYVCGVICPIWLPFETSSFIRVYITLCGFVVSASTAVVTTQVAYVTLSFVHLLVLRLEHLRRMIEKMNNEHTDSSMRNCFKYHQKIVKLNNIMNDFFGMYPLIYCSQLPLSAAMLIYLIMLVKNSVAIVIFLPNFIIIISACLYCEHFRNENYKLLEAAYNLPWYEWNLEQQTFLKMFMFRLQKPLQVQLRPFTVFSNVFLHLMAKQIYTFVMFLLQT